MPTEAMAHGWTMTGWPGDVRPAPVDTRRAQADNRGYVFDLGESTATDAASRRSPRP